MADYVHAFALILSQQIVTIPYGHQFSSPASIPLLHMRQVQCLSCDSTPTPSQTASEVDKLYSRELCQKKKSTDEICLPLPVLFEDIHERNNKRRQRTLE